MRPRSSGQAEQGVADAFNDYYRRFAARRNQTGRTFSVGARDRYVAGDYILTADSCFTLVEFKWGAGSISAEQAKVVAQRLCRELEKPEDAGMRALAAKCHRIAWKNGSRVEVAPYFEVVCKRRNDAVSAGTLCEEWVNPPPEHRLSVEEFQTYIDWLVGLAKAAPEELLLIGANVSDETGIPELILSEFYGVAELKTWLDDNEPQPSTESTFQDGP